MTSCLRYNAKFFVYYYFTDYRHEFYDEKYN